jgi:hypothetical protein
MYAPKNSAPPRLARASGPERRIRRFDHAEHQQQRTGGAGDDAREVVTAALFPLVRRDQLPRRDQGDERDRGGQQERPAPADLGQQAGEHEPGGVAAGAEHGEDADRLVAGRALLERRGDDGQRGRGGERGGQALDEAARDEQRAVVDEPAEQRGQREHGDGDEEHAAAAEQVGGAPAEQQQPAVTQDVPADDPLQRVGGQAEIGLDGGERDPDHRHVERVEADDDRDGEQDTPETCVPPS